MRTLFLLALGTLLPLGVQAVNISSIYFSSCMRENGVIINVDENQIQLLTQEGRIFEIPRYEIIYMAYYPLESHYVFLKWVRS